MKIEKRFFGQLPTGEEIFLFRVNFSSGMYFELTNFGATWVSAVVPDKNGRLNDVLLGYNTPEGYFYDTAYIGSTVGRFANRIANASFKINGTFYHLDQNDGENSNHGGFSGFNKRVFSYIILDDEVYFSLFSQDRDGGFPGNIVFTVRYVFNYAGEVKVIYQAVSDEETYVNFTNHTYFNLKGEGLINNHLLQVPATKFLVTNQYFIPTGEVKDVTNTVFDFTSSQLLGPVLNSNENQVIVNKGLNHCYVLENSRTVMKDAALLYEPESGRLLTVKTTQPAIIVYSAGFLSSEVPGKMGRNYSACEGICLETQNFPDFPNHPEFNQSTLKANERYEQVTIYQFSIR